MPTLHENLNNEFLLPQIEAIELPLIITQNLSKGIRLRPYQIKAFQQFLYNLNSPAKTEKRHNLFHMATGSGKTVMMAGLMLYMYSLGFRNFLFFVNRDNIVKKTSDNFINQSSSKYLFADVIRFEDKIIQIKEVENFQSTNPDDLNISFQTIQGLHLDLNNPKENSLTYDDFENVKVVMLADEAHHLDAELKAEENKKLNKGEQDEITNWGGTVSRIFSANHENKLFEFTATKELKEPKILEKYANKIIFDYTLKQFRIDKYSKEVILFQSGLGDVIKRALLAAIISQFRLKRFENKGIIAKPIVMFKSRVIAENKEYFDAFIKAIENLNEKTLYEILSIDHKICRQIKDYIKNIDDFIIELQEAFKAENLLLVDSKNNKFDATVLNNLEENQYRGIFAVDMLNEGWDVLNLFDIVRMYVTNTNDTTSEAQLIGRGARYCPFSIKDNDAPKDQRKFDEDLNNDLRMCEELYYHSQSDNNYISNLKTELIASGIIAEQKKEVEMKLKESFKDTNFYKSGYIFLNKQIKKDNSGIFEIPDSVRNIAIEVNLQGNIKASSQTAFDENTNVIPIVENNVIENISLKNIRKSIIYKAIRQNDFFTFQNLKRYLPNLDSMAKFIEDDKYIGNVSIDVKMTKAKKVSLTPDDYLFIVTNALNEIKEAIKSTFIEYSGSDEFEPLQIQKVFSDKKLLFSIGAGENNNASFGKSMVREEGDELKLNLDTLDWYAFDDCYGTSEEKHLIKFISHRIDELKQTYEKIYLIRNERHFKIYNFDDGRALEPDFVLFLEQNGKQVEIYQIFIEPKGENLIEHDIWKQNLLVSLKEKAKPSLLLKDKKFNIWGFPFYNHAKRNDEFIPSFNELVN